MIIPACLNWDSKWTTAPMNEPIYFLLEDPEYLAGTLTGSLNWDYTPDFELYRYDCDPEVA